MTRQSEVIVDEYGAQLFLVCLVVIAASIGTTTKTMMFIVTLDEHWYLFHDWVGDLNWYLHGYMHGVRYGLSHVHGNWAWHWNLNWNVDWIRYVLHNWIRNVLYDWNGNLNWNMDRVRLVNMNWNWVGNRYGYLLDDRYRVWFRNWNFNFFSDGYSLDFAVSVSAKVSSKSAAKSATKSTMAAIITSEVSVTSTESAPKTSISAIAKATESSFLVLFIVLHLGCLVCARCRGHQEHTNL
jgi:hypothetical protein